MNFKERKFKNKKKGKTINGHLCHIEGVQNFTTSKRKIMYLILFESLSFY